jgi:hypothetical protein
MVVGVEQRQMGPAAAGFRLCSVDLDARPTAVVRGRVPSAEFASWLSGALRRVTHELQRQGVATVEHPFVRYLHTAAGVTVEAGFLVREPIEDAGDVVASGLPGGPAIMAVDVLRRHEFEDAQTALRTWLSARGFRPTGSSWEHHRTGSRRDATHTVVDIVVPYRWR